MKVLVDAAFPQTIDRLPNADGVEVHRVADPFSDYDLIDYAAAGGYHAIVFIDAEMVSRSEFRDRAREEGITFVCSANHDPLEAEVNLRRWLVSIRDHVLMKPRAVLWLRRDGVRVDRVDTD